MDAADDPLFEPVTLGELRLPNRIVMSPLTRCRAVGEGRVPNALMAEYYAQRASAGLVVSEATVVTPYGHGYPNTPGIYTDAQVEGWSAVASAVRAAGGRMVLQLWHCGRSSHPSFLPGGVAPLAPSPVAITKGEVTAADFSRRPYPVPREAGPGDLDAVREAFRDGAAKAKAAGFDGVEIHSANGYLLDQFLRDGVNKRRDLYGGSIENRVRFPLEIVDVVCGVWGAGRVGVRVSPSGVFNDMRDSDPLGLFTHYLRELSARKIAYAHVIDADQADVRHGAERLPFRAFRDVFEGALVMAGGLSPDAARSAYSQGLADAFAFGRLFISNPDLPRRLATPGAPLAPWNEGTFYTPGPEGYVDYPPLGGSAGA